MIKAMCYNTKRKVLLLAEEIKGALEDDCYYLAQDLLIKLKVMNKRHIKKIGGLI